jgi:magnesium-protoporphyrin IX monomethyl ester (oxidative) cyclase
MTDVCLVNMPYGALERPTLALSMLKASLTNAGIDCGLFYPTFAFAEKIGSVPYADLVWVRGEMIGEWTFSGAAFPDFKPDHESYLKKITDTYAPNNEAEAKKIRDFLWRIRNKAEIFIEETAQEIIARRPRIVGCSSTFNQHCAVLGLTRRIKELDPSVITILGGGNCEGEMGLTTAREFPWVDFVVSGEADDLFAPFCRLLLERGPDLALEDIPDGVFGRQHRARPDLFSKSSEVPRAMVKNLSDCAIPDFDDYFQSLEQYSGRQYVTPGLLIETSRGCWWGMINHCTFCGLNGGGMSYRSKPPERAISEFLHLARKYKLTRFLVVDNILDLKYFHEVLPALAAAPEEFTLFYEIKSNISYEQLKILRDAGVTWLQPGIESLHDDALKLMKKGTHAWVNLQLLKWARELGLSIAWNVLCGFPGEADEWYGEMADLIPLIHHLEPSTELRPIRFDRFSPYQARPEEFGLKLKPAWPYTYIYPLSEEVLAELVYGFEEVSRPPQYSNPLRLRREEEAPSLGGPGRDLLQKRIREWHDTFLSRLSPILSMTEDDESTLIIDTRAIAVASTTVLSGLHHRAHRACYASVTLEAVRNAVNNDGGPAVDAEQIGGVLDDLVRRKLILRLGNRYLGLAIKGELPALPRNHREGYPGGWISRPNRRNGHRPRPASVTDNSPRVVGALVQPQSVTFKEPLLLDGGKSLPEVTITYETYGTLSPARDNAILVCHPLTKNAHAAGKLAESDPKPGWWDTAIGPGRVLDTKKYFVISADVVGGSGGTTGPASINPATGRRYATDFPVVTVADMVRAQRRLIEHLEIERLFAVTGGCFGGQQALEWAILYPDAVKNAVIINATPWTSAHTVAIFNIMRRLICDDPDWNGGNYYGGKFPSRGMANALTAAVPLWMSREVMEKKFGRRLHKGPHYTYSFETEFEVEYFLEQVASRSGQSLDPNGLIYLMRSMEYFDLPREYGSLENAFSSIQANVLLISYLSDWRYPSSEVQRMQEAMETLGINSQHVMLDSAHGHGAFISDISGCAAALQSFFARSTVLDANSEALSLQV